MNSEMQQMLQFANEKPEYVREYMHNKLAQLVLLHFGTLWWLRVF